MVSASAIQKLTHKRNRSKRIIFGLKDATHLLFISYSTVSHRLLISYTSVTQRLLIGYSLVTDRLLIGHSSVTDRYFIGNSSVTHRFLIDYSSVTHQFRGSGRLELNVSTAMRLQSHVTANPYCHAIWDQVYPQGHAHYLNNAFLKCLHQGCPAVMLLIDVHSIHKQPLYLRFIVALDSYPQQWLRLPVLNPWSTIARVTQAASLP